MFEQKTTDAPRPASEIPTYRYEGPLKKAVSIAEYYGFRLLPEPALRKNDRVVHNAYRYPARRISLLRNFAEQRLGRWRGPALVALVGRTPARRSLRLSLEIIGTPDSTAEAHLLQVTSVILRELGRKNLCAIVNSLGGPESIELYTRAALSYFRKHSGELDARSHKLLREHPLDLIATLPPDVVVLREHLPQSLGFLTDASRKHFTSVLDHLEALSIPYRLDGHYLGDHRAASRSVYSLRSFEDDELSEHRDEHASGFRYDTLARSAGLKRDVPAAGIDIDFPSVKFEQRVTAYRKHGRRLPSVHLVQLGSVARQRLLVIAENLRQANINATHTIHEQYIAPQLAAAEGIGASFVVIIGQREILEDSAIVRSLSTRSQETVPLCDLPRYLARRFRR